MTWDKAMLLAVGCAGVTNLIANANERLLILNPALREPEPPAEPAKRLTPKQRQAQQVADALAESDFGCQNANVRRVVTALFGGSLPTPTVKGNPANARSHTFVEGAAVVCAGHLFIISRVDGDGDACPVEGVGPNQLDLQGYYDGTDLERVATPEEIGAILDDLFPRATREEAPATATEGANELAISA